MIKRMNSNYEVLRLLTSRSEGDKEDREEREKEKDKRKLVSSINVFGGVTSCLYRQIRLKKCRVRNGSE